MALLLAGSGGHPVTKISVGESETPPNVNNSSITNAFTKEVDSVTLPSPNAVRFTFSLNANEANGMAITELGLLTSNNTLFSRKVRSVINKTNDVIITGIWTVYIN